MKWRRLLVPAATVVIVVGLYKVAVLLTVTAKVLGFDQPFDWWRGPVLQTSTSIGSLQADVYTTPRSRTPVLFVHGVNETGKDSHDLKPVAHVLAGSGFRVVVPNFARLTKQNVTPEDVDDIALAFQSLGRDGGVICASYGCGPALIAASRPSIRDHVKFVLTFGAYYDLTDTLRFIVTSPYSPLTYSKWLYMAANSDLLADEADRREIRAISEERLRLPSQDWVRLGSGLSRHGQALLSLYESSNGAEFDQRLRAIPILRNRTEDLSPSRYLEGMRARLIIVHMSSDPSIPCSQSVSLAEAAKARRIPYSLTILQMHGHTRPETPEVGLGSLFSFYLPQGLQFAAVLRELLSFAERN